MALKGQKQKFKRAKTQTRRGRERECQDLKADSWRDLAGEAKENRGRLTWKTKQKEKKKVAYSSKECNKLKLPISMWLVLSILCLSIHLNLFNFSWSELEDETLLKPAWLGRWSKKKRERSPIVQRKAINSSFLQAPLSIWLVISILCLSIQPSLFNFSWTEIEDETLKS